MHFLRPTWTPTGHTAQYSFLKVGATNDNPNQREKAALAWRAFCVPNLLLRIRGSRVRNQGRASLHRDRAGLGDRAEVPAPETSPQWGLESPEEVPLGLGAPPSLATPEQRRGGGLLRESFVDEAPFQRHYHNSRPLGICYQPEASLPRLELGGKGRATAPGGSRSSISTPAAAAAVVRQGPLAACSCLALSGLAEARGCRNPQAPDPRRECASRAGPPMALGDDAVALAVGAAPKCEPPEWLQGVLAAGISRAWAASSGCSLPMLSPLPPPPPCPERRSTEPAPAARGSVLKAVMLLGVLLVLCQRVQAERGKQRACRAEWVNHRAWRREASLQWWIA